MDFKEKAINLANKYLSKFNRKIIVNVVVDRQHREKWIEAFLIKQSNENIKKILSIEDLSMSQHKQDLFVLAELNFKSNGFFVEFGATNGQELSNTHILEKHLNWNGILSEPAKGWHNQLKINRTCHIETRCVWSKSDEKLDFFEAKAGVLSTITKFRDADKRKRIGKKLYKVNTISLLDLLKKYDAPHEIDYLSIDTEGSELEILESFDFNSYNIKIITVEHNGTLQREKIFNLLTKNNYKRKYTEISKCDDWYVRM